MYTRETRVGLNFMKCIPQNYFFQRPLPKISSTLNAVDPTTHGIGIFPE